MKKLLPVVFLLFLSFPVAAEQTLDLASCYQKALERSESVASVGESIEIAKARRQQALETVLPHVNLRASEFIQDSGASTGDATGNTFTRRTRPEVAITARQPLFQGFREFHSIKAASAEKKKNSLEWQRAKQLLFLDVATAFYTTLEHQEGLHILEGMLSIYRDRMNELTRRIDLGKSRTSERLTTEVRLSMLEAQIADQKSQLEHAKADFEFLIGERPGKLSDTLPSLPLMVSPSNHESTILRQAQDERYDLQATRESIRMAKGQLAFERGAYFPTIDVEGNYYPYRVGFYSDIKWDVRFNLNLPLFEGGLFRGKVREAKALLQQTTLAHSEAERRAESQLQTAAADYEFAQQKQKALQTSVAKAEKNAQEVTGEYRHGLTTNLDVLEGLHMLQEQKLEAVRASHATKLRYIEYTIATGKLPVDDTP